MVECGDGRPVGSRGGEVERIKSLFSLPFLPCLLLFPHSVAGGGKPKKSGTAITMFSMPPGSVAIIVLSYFGLAGQ